MLLILKTPSSDFISAHRGSQAAEYFDTPPVLASIAAAVPELVSMLHDRHGSLPELPAGLTFIRVTHCLLKLACMDEKTILSHSLAQVYLEAKRFWQAVFTIGEKFTSGSAASWDDVLPGFTGNCLGFLERCVELYGVWMQGGGRLWDPSSGCLTRDAMIALGGPFWGFDLGPAVGVRVARAFLESTKGQIVSLHDGMVGDPDNDALQIVSCNEIRCLCGLLVRLTNRQISAGDWAAVIEEVKAGVLGEAGRV